MQRVGEIEPGIVGIEGLRDGSGGVGRDLGQPEKSPEGAGDLRAPREPSRT
jgi:hypothetical protein